MGTASITFNQYAFTNISCVDFHIFDHLVLDLTIFLLHHGNGLFSFTLVLLQFFMVLFFHEIYGVSFEIIDVDNKLWVLLENLGYV